MPDHNFAELNKTLYSAVLSDVLDGLGWMNQAMRPFVQPLSDDTFIMRRARTGLYMNAYRVAEGENPYEHEIALLDDLKPGDVAVSVAAAPPIPSRHRANCCRRPPRAAVPKAA